MDEIVKKRMELQKYLMDLFPEAENVIVKSCCDREIATVKLNGNSAGAVDKVFALKERALPKTPFIRVRDLDFGFSIEGPSPSHLLAMLQE